MKFSTTALVTALTVAATATATTSTSTVDAFAFVVGRRRPAATTFVPKSGGSALSYRMDPEQELFEQELMEQQFRAGFGHAVVGGPPPPPPPHVMPPPPPIMSPEQAAAADAAAFHQQQQEFADIRREPRRNHNHNHNNEPLKSRQVEERRERLADNGMSSQPVIINDIFSTSVPKKIQGNGALKTWTVRQQTERVQVLLKAKHDMPLRAELEVWNGPENVPFKLHAFAENGSEHPLSLVVNTPDVQNAVAIKNVGQMEFPFEGVVLGDSLDDEAGRVVDQLEDFGEHGGPNKEKEAMNGESVESYNFSPQVEAVQILLKSAKGRPLHARVEITQGPGHVKQYLDVFSENGTDRPLFCVLDTPGCVFGSTVRVVNTGTMVFPFKAYVEPYLVTDKYVPPESSVEGAPINKDDVQVDNTDNSFIV
eukprot:CAMPEP_0113480724 /NCGR_PEP_ID=MMETSP0014_2-20120614/22028_1 /TAXON_ID=2857 /ORGANISM="Nitzschia sp." /LENGTH=423 /DNA_ID=CAMNT_0000374173 /DNA_START=17 /DNA_END=1288 /DNA_ORIENTATION=+ /assembly_acc=CAM_ASM_000159